MTLALKCCLEPPILVIVIGSCLSSGFCQCFENLCFLDSQVAVIFILSMSHKYYIKFWSENTVSTQLSARIHVELTAVSFLQSWKPVEETSLPRWPVDTCVQLVLHATVKLNSTASVTLFCQKWFPMSEIRARLRLKVLFVGTFSRNSREETPS